VSGADGTNGTAPKPLARRRDYCPDVGGLRRLLERAAGTPLGSQARLAELVGCTAESISLWERGGKPSRAYRPRLVELEKKLKEKKVSLDDELAGRAQPERPEARVARAAPVFVNVISLKLDSDLALLHFGAKLPGDEEARTVADVLVSRIALEAALDGLKKPVGLGG